MSCSVARTWMEVKVYHTRYVILIMKASKVVTAVEEKQQQCSAFQFPQLYPISYKAFVPT